MKKDSNSSIITPSKNNKESKKNPQTAMSPKRSEKNIDSQEYDIQRTPSPKNKLSEFDSHIQNAPRMQTQFQLSRSTIKKFSKNLKLNELSKEYIYFVDSENPSQIVSYLNEETFSIVLRRPKHQYVELLQQIRQMDRFIHKNEKLLRSFLKIYWMFVEGNTILDNPTVKKFIRNIQFADKTLKLKFSQQSPSCLKVFSHIKFDSLQLITIESCKIDSIEPISWIYCPNLKEIQIKSTEIRSFKSFQKSKFTKIQVLSINNNYVREFQASRMKFTKIGTISAINSLALEYESYQQFGQPKMKETICFEDMSQFAKTECCEYFLMKNFYPNRIAQYKIMNVLLRKDKRSLK